MSDRLTVSQMIRRLLPFWRPAAPSTGAGILLLVTAGALEIAQPWPIKWLVDSVFDHRPLPVLLSSLDARLEPGQLSQNPMPGVAVIVAAILAIALGHKLATLLSQYFLVRAGTLLTQRLRERVIDHLHRQSLRFHDKNKVGDLIYRAAYDSCASHALLTGAAAPVIAGVVLLVGIIVVMTQLDWMLTVSSLAIVPVFWLLTSGFGRAIEKRSKAHHEHQAGFYSMLLETLSAVRIVQAFTAENRVAAHVREEANVSRIRLNRMTFAQLLFSFSVGVAMAAGTALVVYLGALRVLQAQLTIGEVLVFLAYLGMLYTPINAFTQSAATSQTAGAQLNRVFELLDVAPDIASPRNARVPEKIAGEFVFQGLTFGYDPAHPVLRDIDVAVRPGDIVAIVGRTGSGKSSLISLLPRFYDPQQGRVLLDGTDLRDLDLHWLREQIAIVPQEPILFAGTIRENIAFGREGASMADIRIAAEQARAADFIESLPAGYETVLGDRGARLSGGQRQRIAIARAFLRDAPVLILDEPTSALDATTESELLASVDQLMHSRTAFVIAHRLSTIRNADVIWVLDNGRIVQQGTHDELLGQAGIYRSLCESQFGIIQEPMAADVLQDQAI